MLVITTQHLSMSECKVPSIFFSYPKTPCINTNPRRKVKNRLCWTQYWFSCTISVLMTVWRRATWSNTVWPGLINPFLQFNVETGERCSHPLHRTLIWLSMRITHWRTSKPGIDTMLQLIQGAIDSHRQHVGAHAGTAARTLSLTPGVCGCECGCELWMCTWDNGCRSVIRVWMNECMIG